MTGREKEFIYKTLSQDRCITMKKIYKAGEEINKNTAKKRTQLNPRV